MAVVVGMMFDVKLGAEQSRKTLSQEHAVQEAAMSISHGSILWSTRNTRYGLFLFSF